MSGFDALGVPAPLVRSLAAAGFETPLPVQEQALPALLDGRDMVVSAVTGSGKTLAYTIPIVARLLAPSPANGSPGARRPLGPRALVLAPTRELAAQIHAVAARVGKPHGVRTELVHGGVGFARQKAALSGAADVIVATPGRLRDHITRGNAELSQVTYTVLDEADRMLELGFLEDVRFILRALAETRQSVLCSATLNDDVAAFALAELPDAERIALDESETAVMPAGLTHLLAQVRQPLKRLLLIHLLQTRDWPSVVVFVKTRFRCQVLADALAAAEVSAEPLHADLNQTDRTATLDRFRSGEVRVLVATDLAERGLDVPRITHVLNFDPPNSAEIYVHRVGRTARQFGQGTAITFVAGNEGEQMTAISDQLALVLGPLPTPGFDHKQRVAGHDPLIPPARSRGPKTATTRSAPPPDRPPTREQFWDRVRKKKAASDRKKGKPPQRRNRRK